MGYFSCRSKTSVLTCDSQINTGSSSGKRKKENPKREGTSTPGIRRFHHQELESATCNFHPSAFLGRGSHGSVFRASLDGGRLLAAAKVTSPDDFPSSAADPSSDEIEILSSIRSPLLVNLLGYTDHSPRITVVELMPNGSLHDHLHYSPNPVGWPRRVRFVLHTGKAVLSLHSLDPPVIHRDIKSSNVLIDAGWNARLGDFGLAVRSQVGSGRFRSTPPAGTMGYIDPGYVVPADLSTKSDVFSFGILLLEILSGRKAIDVDFSPPSLVDFAESLIERKSFDEIWDPRIGRPESYCYGGMRDLVVLAGRCVGLTAEMRPDMGEVVRCIETVDRRVSSPPAWDEILRRLRCGDTLGNRKVSDVATYSYRRKKKKREEDVKLYA